MGVQQRGKNPERDTFTYLATQTYLKVMNITQYNLNVMNMTQYNFNVINMTQ